MKTQRSALAWILKTVWLSLGASLIATTAHAATHYQRLKSFGFPESGGKYPDAPVLQASDGVLYGMTSSGGASNFGTIFRVGSDGTSFSVLHSFSKDMLSHQLWAEGGLLEGSDGALYGATSAGGAFDSGTVFRVNKDGSGYEVLYNFGADIFDGYNPSGLVEGIDGTLYGTTLYGGTNGYGTVFAVKKDGSGYGVVHAFLDSGNDGAYPGGLMRAGDGVFYGTSSGGTNGAGMVFKLNSDGTLYGLLYNFNFSTNGIVGVGPGALVEGSDGALYGVGEGGTEGGGLC